LPAASSLKNRRFSLSNGRRFLRINFTNKKVREDYAEHHRKLNEQLQQLSNRTKANLIHLSTRDDNNQRLAKLIRGVV